MGGGEEEGIVFNILHIVFNILNNAFNILRIVCSTLHLFFTKYNNDILPYLNFFFYLVNHLKKWMLQQKQIHADQSL